MYAFFAFKKCHGINPLNDRIANTEPKKIAPHDQESEKALHHPIQDGNKSQL